MKRVEKEFCAAVVIISVLIGLIAGLVLNHNLESTKKQEATSLVDTYGSLIESNLKNEYKYTNALVTLLEYQTVDEVKASSEYNEILNHEEVLSIDIKTAQEISQMTDNRQSLLNNSYPYRLASLKEEAIVYGPIDDQELNTRVMAVVSPVYRGEDMIYGVLVSLDCDKVVETLGLDELVTSFGYDYQLSSVSDQTGDKNVVATSDENTNYLNVIEKDFEMPSKWALVITPQSGWSRPLFIYIGVAFVLGIILSREAYLYLMKRHLDEEIDEREHTDRVSKIMNQKGFLRFSEKALSEGKELTVLVVVVDNAHKMYNLLDIDKRESVTNHLLDTIRRFAKNKTSIARIQENMFLLIYEKHYCDSELKTMMKEIEIDIISSQIIDGKRITLKPYLDYFTCPNGDKTVMECLAKTQKDIYSKID